MIVGTEVLLIAMLAAAFLIPVIGEWSDRGFGE